MAKGLDDMEAEFEESLGLKSKKEYNLHQNNKSILEKLRSNERIDDQEFASLVEYHQSLNKDKPTELEKKELIDLEIIVFKYLDYERSKLFAFNTTKVENGKQLIVNGKLANVFFAASKESKSIIDYYRYCYVRDELPSSDTNLKIKEDDIYESLKSEIFRAEKIRELQRNEEKYLENRQKKMIYF